MITLNVSNQICLFLALFTFGLHQYCGLVMITLNVSNQICLLLALFTFGLHWYCGQVMITLNVSNQICLLLALFTFGLHWYCGQAMITLNVSNQICLLLALFTFGLWFTHGVDLSHLVYRHVSRGVAVIQFQMLTRRLKTEWVFKKNILTNCLKRRLHRFIQNWISWKILLQDDFFQLTELQV